MRYVGDAKSAGFELKCEALRDPEVSHHTHVEVEISRTAQNITSAVAEESIEQARSGSCHLLESLETFSFRGNGRQ